MVSRPVQNASTTEDGAYTLNGAITDAALSAVSRNAGARWFIPSESEWYKAAYYDARTTAQGGPPADSHYWAYPTQSNSTPYSDQPPGNGAPTQSNTANYFSDDSISNGYNDGYAVTGSAIRSGSQNYLTNVGAYTSATSAYGTFDQGGNVWEWNEASLGGTSRGVRGGSWADSSIYLPASFGFSNSSATESDVVGFRVATMVPEPSTGVLAILACGLMSVLRKRFK